MSVLSEIYEEVNPTSDNVYNLQHLIHFLEGYRGRVLFIDNPYASGSARYESYEAGYKRAERDFFISR